MDTQMRECDLETPKRNRYFFGQLLDVDHFQRIDRYVNGKRWMLNRLVSGVGVVCGLDVRFGPDGRSVIVSPGLAVDRHGREIVVGRETAPIPIPAHLLAPKAPSEGYGGEPVDPEQEPYGSERGGVRLHVVICYHECEVDPAPVHAGSCHEYCQCQPGSIEERYGVLFRPGCLPQPAPASRIPGLFKSGTRTLDYGVLARWVSRKCPESPRDACIPLANLFVRVGANDSPCGPDVDVTVRPICFSNDLLVQLVLGLAEGQPDSWTNK